MPCVRLYGIIPRMKKFHSSSSKIPRVVAVVSMQSSFGPSVLRGVFAHIAASGEWILSIVRSPKEFTEESVRQAILHKVSGFIFAFDDEMPALHAVASPFPSSP